MSARRQSLWARSKAGGQLHRRFLRGISATITLQDLERTSSLSEHRDSLRDRAVLIATRDQLTAALALIELDGIASRLVLCPPGHSNAELQSIATAAHTDACIVDDDALGSAMACPKMGSLIQCTPTLRPINSREPHECLTEWVLLTSGTTGMPKLVSHTLASLAGELQVPYSTGAGLTWSTFYDIRRYGGLQILLRALLGAGSLLLSDAQESVADFMARASAAGVTHFTGTPSHWRRILMSGSAQLIHPSYVRLSGETADQSILDHLRASYPTARIVHAFASTEAGLAFEVSDERAGFPASMLAHGAPGLEIRIEQGSMLIRSPRTASHYLNQAQALRREDGFVDTHDLVELRDGRYYFAGRREGIINVGGQKCHPEEIESVINRHPMVHMSLVKARRNPVLGSIVVADVVLKAHADPIAGDSSHEHLRGEILETCRRALDAHKVPATIRIVTTLDLTPSGKLQRSNA